MGRHIPQAVATAVPSLLAPERPFQPERPLRGQLEGTVGQAGLFRDLMSCWGLEEKAQGFAGGTEGCGGSLGSGFCLRAGLALAPAGTLQGEFKLLLSPWEHVSNSGALHVLLQLWMWQWLGCLLPRDTETWGGGCWGILDWLQCHLHSGEARLGRSAQPPTRPGSPGSSEGSGASRVASC